MPDAVNEAQVEFWNGPAAREWVTSADRYDGMIGPFGDRVLGAAAVRSGERVLDVGCGNGMMTLQAAERARPGAVTGVDISAPMLEVARGRAEALGLDTATFLLADAQADDLGGPHDVAISRFGIMFFEDSLAAFRNIHSALVPGARVAFVCWRTLFENEWVLVPNGALLQHVPPPDLPAADAPGPFRFGEPGSLPGVLTTAGFEQVSSEAFDLDVLVGGPATFDEAFEFMSHSTMTNRIIGDAPDDVRARALRAMREVLEPFRAADGIRMHGAVWLVQARA